MKCYSSGFGDDFLDLQRESVWEKRETSLSIKQVKDLNLKLSNCQEMKWLSAFSVLEFDFEMTVNIHVWKI